MPRRKLLIEKVRFGLGGYMKRFFMFWVIISFILSYSLTLKAKEIKIVKSGDVISMIATARSQLVLVSFWASWCPPCRMEIPGLIKLRTVYDQEELSILGVSLDESPAMYLNFINKVNFNYPVFLGRGDVVRVFEVSGLPKLIIYNQNGQKLYVHEGYISFDELNRKIGEFLQ